MLVLAVFKKPITWMVLAECVVVIALAAAAWQMLTSSRVSSAAVPEALAPSTASADAAAPSLPESADQPALELGPLPGLNLARGFWRDRLVELNREEAAFERLEWKLVSAIMNAVRSYMESVVLPAISRAERGALLRRAP